MYSVRDSLLGMGTSWTMLSEKDHETPGSH